MGNIGTSVARNASDIVLLDDNYSTIVKGVEEGRRIFVNIKKAIVFLLATNFAEILVLLVALLLKLPVPLLPLHILFINLLTDSIPALALAAEPLEKDTMNKNPKSANEGFFTGALGIILFLGSLIAMFVLSLFYFSQQMGATLGESQSLAFVTLSILEMAVIISLRTHENIFTLDVWKNMNKWVVYALFIVIVITVLAIVTPVSSYLKLELFDSIYWLWILGGSIFTIFSIEIFKKFSDRW